MQVKLNNVIAKPFHPIFRPFFENEIDELALKGGRGSTKSSAHALLIIFGMMKDYHQYGLITNAVCLRKVGLSLSRSVYNQIKWAIDKLECSDDWYCTKSPLECIYKPSGQKVLFSGCDDPIKLKSIKFDKGYCKYIWFEEVDQYKDMAEIRNVIQTLARGGKNIIMYSFNPPPSMNNWCNFEFDKHLNYRLTHSSTYLDVPRHWLDETFYRIAEQLKRDNPKAYDNEYMGIVGGLGGEIFTNVINFPVNDEDILNYDKLRNGLDWGYEDPTAFIQLHYDHKEIILLNEIYETHLHLDSLYEMIKNIINYGDLIRADSASPGNISELKSKGLYIIGAEKPKNSINRGIKFLQGLRHIKIDRKRCPKAYWEFSTYEKEKDKFGEFRKEYPDKNNHIIDGVRYSLSDIINHSGWKVPRVS
jgi:PBSX family phage terminase large subunit